MHPWTSADGHSVFISYAREDVEIVERIRKALEAEGLPCWSDCRGVRWGEPFPEEIVDDLHRSQYVLICLSSAFLRSAWCMRELDFALFGNSCPDERFRPHVLPLLLAPDSDRVTPSVLGDRRARVYDGNPTALAVAIAHLGACPTEASDEEWSSAPGLEFDAELLSKYDSRLSSERRMEIASSAIGLLPKLRAHRKDHVRRLRESWKPHLRSADMSEPAWARVNSTQSAMGSRLTIGFRNRACEYRRTDPLKLGCFNCGYYAGTHFSKASTSQLLDQMRRGFRAAHRLGRLFDVVEFLSDGSFLSHREMDDGARLGILARLREMPYVRRVLVETTPEHVYRRRNGVQRILDCLREDQCLEFGIGFETADDFIRKTCINKGFLRSHFERAVDHLASINGERGNDRCAVVAYILVRPAFLTDREAIEDVLSTLRYLNRLSSGAGIKIVPKLEPAAIADGTLLSFLFKHGDKENRYSPVNYWMILEILTRALRDESCKPLNEWIRIGAREDMDDVLIVPAIYAPDGRFDPMDFVLYDAIQAFNQHRDLERLYAVLRSTHERGVEGLLHARGSLFRWANRELGSEEQSTIVACLRDPRNAPGLELADERARLDSDFLGHAYRALDVLEGYVDQGEHVASSIRELVLEEESVSQVVMEQIESIVAHCFNQVGSTMCDIRMIDVKVHPSEFVRLFFEATNFLSGRTHVIWSEVPIDT